MIIAVTHTVRQLMTATTDKHSTEHYTAGQGMRWLSECLPSLPPEGSQLLPNQRVLVQQSATLRSW